MGAVREYRKQAEECRQLARLMHNPDKKDILKHLAQTWERLAEFRERLEPELELPSSLLHELCQRRDPAQRGVLGRIVVPNYMPPPNGAIATMPTNTAM